MLRSLVLARAAAVAGCATRPVTGRQGCGAARGAPIVKAVD